MALNPYTLNHLYQNGILDYVPTELMYSTPMGTMMPMNNPYLDMAKQGGLYQNHGMAADSFHSSYTPAYTPQYFQSASNSANSYVGANSYNNGRYNAVGTNGYNVYNQSGTGSAYTVNNTAALYSDNYDKNKFGGLTEIPDGVANNVNKTVSFIDKMPKLLLGVVGGTIGTIAVVSAFKHGKKPKTSGTGSGFWSKLNPMNWFRKSK